MHRFIAEQNIANYRKRLESDRLAPAERQSVERLLAEEEAKLSRLPPRPAPLAAEEQGLKQELELETAGIV